MAVCGVIAPLESIREFRPSCIARSRRYPRKADRLSGRYERQVVAAKKIQNANSCRDGNSLEGVPFLKKAIGDTTQTFTSKSVEWKSKANNAATIASFSSVPWKRKVD